MVIVFKLLKVLRNDSIKNSKRVKIFVWGKWKLGEKRSIVGDCWFFCRIIWYYKLGVVIINKNLKIEY